jgi:hypothetical protein
VAPKKIDPLATGLEAFIDKGTLFERPMINIHDFDLKVYGTLRP